ncbi:hypothetical protein DL93DRAFT_2157330 [Clavulina sp. PMI_390]|nr:hypothetical protein DL93DRAFT_2157330 [Clavulina sp. PMI_390]
MTPVSADTAYVITNKQSNTTITCREKNFVRGMWPVASGPAKQQWLVEGAEDGLYYIRSPLKDQPYINYGPEPGPVVCNSNKCPWRIVRWGDSSFRIFNPQGTLCMELDRGSAADDGKIITAPTSGDDSQLWVFRSIPLFNPTLFPNFTLKNVCTGTVADISYWDEQTIVIANSQYWVPRQAWAVEPVNKALNWYYVYNLSFGTYLSVAVDNPGMDSQLILSAKKQIWEIRPDWSTQESESGQIVSIFYPSSGYLVDLPSKSPHNGERIKLNVDWEMRTDMKWQIGPYK